MRNILVTLVVLFASALVFADTTYKMDEKCFSQKSDAAGITVKDDVAVVKKTNPDADAWVRYTLPDGGDIPITTDSNRLEIDLKLLNGTTVQVMLWLKAPSQDFGHQEWQKVEQSGTISLNDIRDFAKTHSAASATSYVLFFRHTGDPSGEFDITGIRTMPSKTDAK